MKLSDKIIEYLRNSEIKLLSQIPISNLEYRELVRYTRNMLFALSLQTKPEPNVMLSMTLVQIAIKNYIDGNYWHFFLGEIGFDVSAAKRNYLGKIFLTTLRSFNLFEIERENNSKQAYVENIKAHAFVPNHYLDGYFDFLFSFYDRNLFRRISDDIEENVYDMIDFMNDSLSSSSDSVEIEDYGNKPAKSYRLLKATKSVIAQCSTTIVCNLIIDHLKMIDIYYYDGKVPENKKDRYASRFKLWSEKKDAEINLDTRINRRRKTIGVFFHKPHFEIDREQGRGVLVIPSQKFRDEEFDGNAFVFIECGDTTIEKKLDMYKAYGVIVSEELKIPIKTIFTSYKIEIRLKTTRTFLIHQKEYHLFDEDFQEIQQLKKGQCYILVEKGTSVNSELNPIYVNTDSDLWDEYSYCNIEEDSVIYINNRPISLVGEYPEKPLFEYVSKEYILFDGEQQVQTAYRHPIISFKIARMALSGTVIYCNNFRYPANLKGISTIYDFDYDSENIGISIKLGNILKNRDGLYKIWIDEPGKQRKLICQYVLITSLRFRLERQRFIFCDKALIYKSGDYDITPQNSEKINKSVYSLDLTTGNEKAKFKLSLGELDYTLIVPIKVFKYGFSRRWNYIRKTYLWHRNLENDLYIYMPGATKAFLYLGKNDTDRIEGEALGDGEFRFDILSYVCKMRESKKAYEYINLQYYDNKWRRLSLFRVLKRLWINKLNMTFSNNKVKITTDYEGDAKLKVRIFDYETKDVITERCLVNGCTDFPELTPNQLYKLEKFEASSDLFGFGETLTSLGIIYKIGAINYDDLSNCKILIKDIICNDFSLNLDYVYSIYDLSKYEDNTYIGKLKFKPKNKNKSMRLEDLFEKVRLNLLQEDKELKILSIHVYEDNDWVEMWYDAVTKRLFFDDNTLYYSKDYNRFIPLYEDTTEYIAEFWRIK
ncbi:MAG TPA: hypothetical protein GX708_23640 [Gallicola sp.]|nr:hypothetical protein [Gallicola sp.]HOA80589.1 hypothetical protein [Defluviitaleaceae bacterium]